jgi:SAM-dependent methyltransferase
VANISAIKTNVRSFLAVPYRLLINISGINPLSIKRRFQGLSSYFQDWLNYSKADLPKDSFKIKLRNIHPCLEDKYDNAGSTTGDYFHQDLWVARKVFAANPLEHWDIGSRVDGFITHLLTFRSVNVIDIRPLESNISGLVFHQGDITNLSFLDNSIGSLSCLHTMEHIGLGRYGDPIDPSGCFKGMKELQRVLAPGGRLYFSVPIGQERVEFNAHRVFNPLTIIESFSALNLINFVAVNGTGDLVEPTQLENFINVKYACGIFVFQKPDS